jgi:hypothetical protein
MLQLFGWARLQPHLPLLPWASWLPDRCFLGLLGFPIASLLAFGHVDFFLGIVVETFDSVSLVLAERGEPQVK